MRIAIISDIHGNLQSLELVLADIQHANVDHTICLGDIASLGPQPREVIARLRELQIPTIMGNHENYLLDLKLTENHHPWLRAAEEWGAAQLSADEMDFMRSLPSQLSFALDPNTTMFCFHGSPRSNEEFIYPTVSPETLDEIFSGQNAKVLVGGHTHVQMVRQHKDMTLLNPGSVGMPFKFPTSQQDMRALRRTEYAVVDMTDGGLKMELCQLPIDFEQMEKNARSSGLPDVEFWLSTWDV